MKKHCSLYFALCIVAVALVSGCNKEHRPADLPKLTPCEITIIDVDDSPIEGASITLRSIGADIPWAMIGQTNSAGVAGMSVNVKYPGVPAGQFKVLVHKLVCIDKTEKIPDFPPNVFVSLNDDSAYYVNPLYGKEKTSPFELTVVDGQPVKQKFKIEKTPKAK